jgi:hypothetical protein
VGKRPGGAAHKFDADAFVTGAGPVSEHHEHRARRERMTVDLPQINCPAWCHSDFGEVLPLDDSRGHGPLLYWADW